MRSSAALALVIACGSGGDKPKDAGPGDDGTVAVDAPVDAAELPPCSNPVAGSTIQARRIGVVVGAALLATSPPRDPRLFVLEQRGAIRIFRDEVLLPGLFLDLSSLIVSEGELGLLGLAFHPHYATNRQFFVFFTRRQAGDPANPFRDVVARCTASAADPDVADPACVEILAVPDYASNHNGGMIEFGKDGYLYIGTGDGGSSNDPFNNGQALVDGVPMAATRALLGKILRLDVDHPAPGKEYGIPADNPYAAGGGAPEIYMRGLRNPWRWSFDRATGDLWIGDVGQDAIEEIDVVPASAQNGKNFGWSMYEGSNCNKPPCSPIGQRFPEDERAHSTGWASVIGGQVYRGTCYPDLVGTYFYTDFIKGGLAKATLQPGGTLQRTDLVGMFPAAPVSLHADARGELYLTTAIGGVHHLEAGP